MIRVFRSYVLGGKIQKLQNLPRSSDNFYSLSECRDLCFHVQEHRYSMDQIRRLLNAHNLVFCGFLLPAKVKSIYQEQYPEDIDMISFANWDEFENKHPYVFAGMYQFWCQKIS